jgi:beta-glucosidase
LNKGETKNISVSIDVTKLAFYDESISDWNLEKGTYIIYVGNASDVIFNKIKIEVQ